VKDEFPYLPIETVEDAVPFASHLNTVAKSRKPFGFTVSYRKALGERGLMALTKRKKRDTFIRRQMGIVRKRKEPLWKDGAPTRRHFSLIMWAFSPTPEELKRWLQERYQEGARS
jgi:hypothetical protein